MAATRAKVIISCADHRLDPHADDVAVSPDHARARSPRRRSRRPRPGPRSCTCTRATRATAGRPPDPDVFMEFLPQIAAATDAVINITTGGGQHMTLEERIAGAVAAEPELASFNMGSMNFGLFPMLARYENLPARVGARLPREQPGFRLPEHVQGHGIRPALGWAHSGRASSSSATTSATCTTWPTSSNADWSSRRSSSRRSSGSSAASARTRTTWST